MPVEQLRSAPDRQWPGAVRISAWLKVFIPDDIPGTVDGHGAAAGHKLLVGPCSWFNDCFHTDNRGFSPDVSASCRMHSEFQLDLTSHELRQTHYCGETIEYDCEDGDIECRATADTSNMGFSNLRWQDGSTIMVDLAGAATNPCMLGSPKLGYTGTFAVDLAARTVAFSGRVNRFPAYEAYATVNGGVTGTVFTYRPKGDPEDFSPVAMDTVSGTARF